MNRIAGIFTASSESNSEGTLCRLCMNNNDYYYNIFTSKVACRISVKDVINALLGLQVAVGDGLPTTLCPLCLKKLTEFSVFKITCLESDAKLRNSSGINCFRSGMGTCRSHCVKADQISDDGGGFVHNYSIYGATNDLVPQASIQAQASTSSQGKEVDAEGTRAIVIDLEALQVLGNQSPKETDATEPTVRKNGELGQNLSMSMESMTEPEELPAPERASSLFAVLEPKIGASISRKGKKYSSTSVSSPEYFPHGPGVLSTCWDQKLLPLCHWKTWRK
ncbi:uncharacterized protein LOC124172289 [Ischnura elegans]|uniref:uncharacterized protein LOC124172289 n=1 Tax=Ischnura elegans TaxID=197161 RepID=UPI001ED882B7|nr:uncharacterized protein LOC124172289 [Ischnura elegans]